MHILAVCKHYFEEWTTCYLNEVMHNVRKIHNLFEELLEDTDYINPHQQVLRLNICVWSFLKKNNNNKNSRPLIKCWNNSLLSSVESLHERVVGYCFAVMPFWIVAWAPWSLRSNFALNIFESDNWSVHWQCLTNLTTSFASNSTEEVG